MLKIIFILFACILLSSCATKQPAKINSVTYEFIFEKKLDYGCVAAFHNEGFLYFVKRTALYPGAIGYSDSYQYRVIVYDLRKNIFVNVPLIQGVDYEAYRNIASCRDVDFLKARPQRKNSISVVISSEFGEIFNNYGKNPDKLKSVIADIRTDPFVADGEWNGGKVIERTMRRIQDIRRINDVPIYLNAISEEVVESWVRNIVGHTTIVHRVSPRKAMALKKWENRMSSSLSLGDEVCTYDTNLFGYVEYINGSKIKVHVIGRVKHSPNEPGYFFSGIEGKFEYSKIESIRWFGRTELAFCDFK